MDKKYFGDLIFVITDLVPNIQINTCICRSCSIVLRNDLLRFCCVVGLANILDSQKVEHRVTMDICIIY